MNLDVIVVTRGGGSYEDLFGFSHPKIIEEIHKSKTCVISAIGHEIDTMLSDYVADIRVATPSVAGEVIALHQRDRMNIDGIENFRKQVCSEIKHTLMDYKIKIQEMDSKIESPFDIIEKYTSYFDKCIYESQNELTNTLNEFMLELRKMNFLVDSKNPKEILKNGYVMIVDPDSKKQIKTADELIFAKDLSETDDNIKKLKLIFNDTTLIIDLDSIVLLNQDE